MRGIRVSDEVWNAIAERGKFGETEDDVLRRIFGLKQKNEPQLEILPNRPLGIGKRRNFTTRRQRARVAQIKGQSSEQLSVSYDDEAPEKWKLPIDRKDRSGIRKVLQEALKFGDENGATIGQRNAIRKALTDAGYHLTK